MNNIQMIIAGLAGVVAIPVLRQAIKSYRAKKSLADVVVDAVEAGIDAVDKK
jgi:hypothetical protein